MAEPLKDLYNKAFIRNLSAAIKKEYPAFNSKKFSAAVFDAQWDNEALKARMRHISTALRDNLPTDYQAALSILKPVAAKCSGFEYFFFPDFVELCGIEHYETSMTALAHFTQYSSSEFPVRPFIVKYGDRMMRQMQIWSASDNHHLRRLASEGCRPRLPWAMALPDFKRDPSPILPILEALKNDDSEYVRRSVANNLNDIAKDHPQLVIDLARRWLGDNGNTDWIVKHGCRTLLKTGNTEALMLFGYGSPKGVTLTSFEVAQSVTMGDTLEFNFALEARKRELGKLRIEYAIDFYKANGSQSRKVFKVAEAHYALAHKQISRRHSFRKISTRVYYPGPHTLAIIVNGKEFACRRFDVQG